MARYLGFAVNQGEYKGFDKIWRVGEVELVK